ncbi:Threonine/homoserine efflux transporter RhtA [Amphritea atlantica]|uniref:Threonine/homoserine efflux transporter RhtA n=1 Tax=Amphritea atlantica TaxID=355243 RepID=A0A1H9DAH2_9GAMM|nr:DMT family transporter [Amphritea atlantica]SEQ10349.1 Threonine/homoserine efflux transporter RhtA [Amphritea atlantica]
MPQQYSNLIRGAALAMATTLLMSLAAAATKYTAGFVSIEQIVLVQYGICTLMMLPWLGRKGLRVLKTEKPWLHLIRGLSGWLCFYTYYLALNNIPLGEASLLRNAAPLMVPLLVLMWLKYRMPLLNWLPIVIGFLGIALVLKPDGSRLNPWHLAAVASCLLLAVSIVTTRVLALSEPTSRILFYYFALSALFSLPLALASWQPVPLASVPLMIGISLSIWCTMWLYTKAYSYAKATVIAPISYFGVLFAGLLGWLFWQQVPDMISVIGAALVISGGIGSVWLGREKN